MKSSELKKDTIYIDITDKKIPLQMVKIENDINIGYNTYVDIVTFKTIKTNINKNWNFPKEVHINFISEGNDRIKPLN